MENWEDIDVSIIVTNEAKRNYLEWEPDFYLVSEPNHTRKFLSSYRNMKNTGT